MGAEERRGGLGRPEGFKIKLRKAYPIIVDLGGVNHACQSERVPNGSLPRLEGEGEAEEECSPRWRAVTAARSLFPSTQKNDASNPGLAAVRDCGATCRGRGVRSGAMTNDTFMSL